MNLERDPSGKSQHQPGAKLDAGKNRLGLVLGGFSRALQAVGRVGTFGATKYTDNGWMSVERGQERYTDAMLRHAFKELEGEVTDPDSGIEHAAHTAWNALARLELMLRERELKTNDLIRATLHNPRNTKFHRLVHQLGTLVREKHAE